MTKSSRRGFVTSTMAAGAAALSAVPNVLASSSNAAAQGGGKEKLKFVVEVGNVGNGSVEDAIQYAKDLQFPAISVTWPRVPGFQETGVVDADRLKAIKAQIEQAGLLCHSMQGSIPRGVLAGGAEADAQYEKLARTFQAMGAAKIDLLMAFAPASRNAQWDQVVGFYKRIMKDLEANGVRIASHSGGLLNSYASMSRLIQAVPSPNNGFCFCTGNVWHAEHEKIYDIPAEVAKRFFFVHVRNVKTGEGEKEYYFDQGDINMPRLLASINKAGFRGYIRSEHLPTDRYNKPSAQSDVGTAWAQGYMRALQELNAIGT
jgi:D-mannonate dehydratase